MHKITVYVKHTQLFCVCFNEHIFSDLDCSSDEPIGEFSHKLELIVLICNAYQKIRFYGHSKNFNQNNVSQRDKLIKAILFLHQ